MNGTTLRLLEMVATEMQGHTIPPKQVDEIIGHVVDRITTDLIARQADRLRNVATKFKAGLATR